jgi:hypothetical protein
VITAANPGELSLVIVTLNGGFCGAVRQAARLRLHRNVMPVDVRQRMDRLAVLGCRGPESGITPLKPSRIPSWNFRWWTTQAARAGLLEAVRSHLVRRHVPANPHPFLGTAETKTS